MNSEHWQKMGFVLFTAEYSAGIIVGLGGGILTEKLLSNLLTTEPERSLMQVVAFFFIFLGASWARASQQKKLQKDKLEKEGGSSN